MDRKSKILLVTLIALIVASIFLTYYRFFVVKDFIIFDDAEFDLTEQTL